MAQSKGIPRLCMTLDFPVLTRLHSFTPRGQFSSSLTYQFRLHFSSKYSLVYQCRIKGRGAWVLYMYIGVRTAFTKIVAAPPPPKTSLPLTLLHHKPIQTLTRILPISSSSSSLLAAAGVFAVVRTGACVAACRLTLFFVFAVGFAGNILFYNSNGHKNNTVYKKNSCFDN